MVAPIVKPLTITTVTASGLVFLESVVLGALPTLALVSTFVGPFVPTIAGAWSRRKVLSASDSQSVFEPLYEEIHKCRDTILASETWSNFPVFQTVTLDQIRASARYRLLKDRTPSIESLRTAMELSLNAQGDARRAASRIIREMTGPILGESGDSVTFHVRTKDGTLANFEGDMWIVPILMRGRDPISVFKRQQMKVEGMAVTDKNSNIKHTLVFPADETKYRKFWESIENKAKSDSDITRFRQVLEALPSLVEQAETQLLSEIRKSRSAF